MLRPHVGVRGYSGPIVFGVVKRGDDVMLLPARQTTRVKSIVELRDGATAGRDYAFAPMSVTLTLDGEIDSVDECVEAILAQIGPGIRLP